MGHQDKRSNHLGVGWDVWVDGHVDERIDDQVDRYYRMDGWMEGGVFRRLEGWMDSIWKGHWMNGYMVGQVNEWMDG